MSSPLPKRSPIHCWIALWFNAFPCISLMFASLVLPRWTRPIPFSHDGPSDRKDGSHLMNTLWAICSLGKWCLSLGWWPHLPYWSSSCQSHLQLVLYLVARFIQKQLYLYQSLVENQHKVPVFLRPISSQGFFPSQPHGSIKPRVSISQQSHSALVRPTWAMAPQSTLPIYASDLRLPGGSLSSKL